MPCTLQFWDGEGLGDEEEIDSERDSERVEAGQPTSQPDRWATGTLQRGSCRRASASTSQPPGRPPTTRFGGCSVCTLERKSGRGRGGSFGGRGGGRADVRSAQFGGFGLDNQHQPFACQCVLLNEILLAVRRPHKVKIGKPWPRDVPASPVPPIRGEPVHALVVRGQQSSKGEVQLNARQILKPDGARRSRDVDQPENSGPVVVP